MPAPAPASLDRIGVGIDTARYGHRVSFLRPDRQPAAKPLTVLENHAGYEALRQRLQQLHQQHPQASFHVRIDAAGQYAANLEHFLRGLPLPLTISIGEPKRNKDYQKAHFPKRTTDDTESQAMARFAVVEQPAATPAVPPELALLREVAARLQAQVKQTTQAINRLHNLLARTFPELATLAEDFSAGWVLELLDRYPTAERIAHAHLRSLQQIPYLPKDKAEPLRQAAQHSVGSLRGGVAETLVCELVSQVRHCLGHEGKLRQLLEEAFAQLPPSGHRQISTITGIGTATAAVLVAKVVAIERFANPDQLVGYFGVFPQEESSGVDKEGQPLSAGTLRMSHKGNDLVRGYLWNAARAATVHNPAIRALYRRLKARGKRGDVALGHCMRKLLHLVFAVWKSDRPFDPSHFPWEGPAESAPQPPAPPAAASNETAVGHTQALPAEKVVTTAASTVEANATAVKPVAAGTASTTAGRPRVDFAFLREQVSMAQVLRQLGLLEGLRGRGQQLRGCCPVHGQTGTKERTFSVHLGKKIFQCFQADCGAHGNVLDLWAAVQGLPLYEAALHLAETFGLRRNREEEPVKGTVATPGTRAEKKAVITADGP
jgi:transposase